MNSRPDHNLLNEILKPILYTDIFDYPLTFDEVYKFLGFEASPQDVQMLLDQAVEHGQIVQFNGFYSLSNRPDLAATRQQRRLVSDVLWPKAAYYGRWIAGLPFVRFVAVTGALAVDNPRGEWDDIDYLIITRAGRLWLCRAMIILMVRYGHLKGVHLCPNYLITENVLAFEDSFFAAREMLQMQSLYGKGYYLKLRELNGWITRYFPHGNSLNLDKVDDELSLAQRLLKKTGEFMLGGSLGNLMEKWLQKKQITKHTQRAEQYGSLDKVIFTPDICKGHFDGHNQKTMRAYRQRVQDYVGEIATNGRTKNQKLE